MIVFLVDDDYEDHEIFKMALEKLNVPFEFITAESGIEAMELFKSDPSFVPDIVFFDVNMPRMNGKECIRELRKMEYLQKIPMILYSTHDGQKEISEAKSAGASDFVTKPSSIPEFTKILQIIINKHVASKA
jgi:CheY-like chemotaxis protein